jgi:CRP-like cAMP-binding protein
LRYILHNCKPIKMKRNQVLVKEGEKKKRIFIVKEGTFSVSKNVLMPKSSE